MKWRLAEFTGLLAVALAFWLWPSIFGGKVLMPLDILAHTPPFAANPATPVHNQLIADMLYENLVWKTLQRECLVNGELPLWNPYNFCGHPMYATGQASTFYPLNLILITIPLPYGYVVFTWLHLLAGGIFTYLFFRRIGVSGFGASVGGVMFAMCTFFTLRLIWPMLLGSAIWLPLMLLWIDWMGSGPTGRWTRGLLGGTVLFAMPILSGFLEITFYVFVACGLYTLIMGVRLWWHERRFRPAIGFFIRVGSVTAMAAILSAPQLLPFFEVMKRNVRVGEITYEQIRNSAMTGTDAITYAIPDALGNPARHEQFDVTSRTWQPIKNKGGDDTYYFGSKNYVEITSYLGLLPLALVALSVRASGQRRVYFWLLAALGLSMAFVTPLYRVFFTLVPGTDQVRSPWRWSLLTAFACTYLAAIGADWWYAQLTAPINRFTRIVATIKAVGAAVFAIAVIALLLRPAPLLQVAERLMTAGGPIAATFASPADLASMLWNNAFRFAVLALATVTVLAMAFWRAWGRTGVAIISSAVVILTALDLGQATYSFNTHSDPAILKQQPDVLKYLQDQADRDFFRVGRFGWQKFIYPNLLALYGLQEFGGYDSIILTDFARYMQGIEPTKLLPYNIISSVEKTASLDSPLYALLNVRYLLCVKPLRHPDYEPVDVPGTLLLYRLKDEKLLPRTFMVSRLTPVPDLNRAIDELKSGRIDVRHQAVVQAGATELPNLVTANPGPPGTARIVDYRATRVRIETNAPTRQLLVLSDMNYPGWRAYVDGEPAPVLATNGIFRGVSVAEGVHTVEFRFSPDRFRLGAVLALVCLASLILATLLDGRTSSSRPLPMSARAVL